MSSPRAPGDFSGDCEDSGWEPPAGNRTTSGNDADGGDGGGAGRAGAAGVAEAKRTARAGVRTRRRDRAALAADDPRRRREAEAIATAILARLPQTRPPTRRPARTNPDPAPGSAGLTVASYVALPTEPPTTALHEHLLARGIRVIVPVLLPDKDLDWVALGGDERPLGQAAIAAAGLVVVPALLVDRTGRRLGQGGGSYDRAMARLGESTERADGADWADDAPMVPVVAVTPVVPVVAVVDDDGLVDHVPHEPHDAAVTAVVRPAHGWTDLPLARPICENRSARAEPPASASRPAAKE